MTTVEDGFDPIPEKYQNTTLSQIRRVKLTQVEMLLDRGYEIPEYELKLLENGIEYFESYYKSKDEPLMESLNQIYYRQGVPLAVYYLRKAGVKQVGVDQITEIIQAADVHRDWVLIVSADPLSPEAQKTVAAQNQIGGHYQVFYFNQLWFNVTKHRLVPKHEPLSLEKTQEILKRNNVDADKIPVIKLDDPVVRYYGLVVNQMVRIVRYSVTPSTDVTVSHYYRIVKE